MNIYSLPPLISALLFIFFGWLVYKRDAKNWINKSFFFICLATFWWQFSWFVLFNLNTEFSADILSRLGYVGIILIPFTFFSFSIYFFRKKHFLDRLLARFFYLPALFFIFYLFLSNYFISGYSKYSWGFYPRAGFMHPLYLLILFLVTLRIIYLTYLNSRIYKNDPSFYKQLKLFLLAIIFYALSAVDFLTNYGLGIYPFGFVFILVFLIIIAYAIVTQQLMNLRFTLRKSIVYFLALLTTLFPFLIWQKFFGLVWPEALYWFDILALVFLLPLFGRLKRHYFHLANKYFFSSLYDSRSLVSSVGKELRLVAEPTEMFSRVAKVLRPAFHFKALGVLYYERKSDHWSLMYNEGFSVSGQRFYLDYRLVSFVFKSKNRAFLVKSSKDPQLESLVSFFEAIKAEAVVPIFVGEQLSALFFLGPKESGDIYGRPDLEVLNIISDELSISMENSLLYNRLQEFNKQLQKKIDKATVKLRLQNEELNKVNQLKNEFISVISHQLKTPLASSKLNLELLSIKFASALSGDAQEMIKNLENINEQLIKMVNELLDIARIEESRLNIDIKPLDIFSLVQKVIREFSSLAEKKKIKIVEKYDPAILVDFDLHIAEKAISNLISNGLKYNREDKNLYVSLEKNKEGLLYTVRDEGIGIPAKEQGKIFQKFYQASNAAASNFESSTGLGLYIVKNMVEQLGGRVWFESVEGEGTSFFILFPFKAVVSKKK